MLCNQQWALQLPLPLLNKLPEIDHDSLIAAVVGDDEDDDGGGGCCD